MIKRREICKNCRRVIIEVKGQWRHISPRDCSSPEVPEREPLPDCTCEDYHFMCHRITCKCEIHSYYINEWG